jgi:ankyrin repeat protein
MVGAFASTEEANNSCTKKHGLSQFTTPLPSIHCNHCANTMAQGAEMYGCRNCNFDLCPICFKADQMEPLQIALRQGNDKLASSLLNRIKSFMNEKEKLVEFLMQEDENKNTILHYASSKGLQNFIKLVLNTCREEKQFIEFVMKENKYKDTVLHVAAQHGQEEIVKLMLNAIGLDENEKLIEFVMKENQRNQSPLFFAASKTGSEIILKLFLNAIIRAEKDKETLFEYLIKEYQYKNTILHYAAQHGQEEIVELLLNVVSEDENEKLIKYLMKENEYKETSLHYASKYGHEKVVKLLLKAFTEKNKELLFEYLLKENKKMFSALNHASKNNHQEIVELLLEAFKNILSIGENENKNLHEDLMKKHSFLHLFSKYGYENTITLLSNTFGNKYKKILLEYLTTEDEYNDFLPTYLHFDSKNSNVFIVQLFLHVFEDKENLIQYLMKPNQQTPLNIAARTGDQNIIQLLLQEFKDEKNHENLIKYVMKESTFRRQDTVLHIASNYGNEDIVNSLLNVFGKEDSKKLIEYVKKQNKYHKTASNLACGIRKESIIQMLSEKKVVQRINQKILFDLQKVTQMFTMHKIIYTDDKKNLWALFQGVMERNTILQYLVTINEDDFINESFKIEKKDKNN